MELEKAQKIVKACVAHRMYDMGVVDEEPPSLYEYSLRELLEANDRVREENENQPKEGVMSFQTVCDDRLVAALYTIYHYEAERGTSIEPICMLGEKALLCARMTPETMVADDAASP